MRLSRWRGWLWGYKAVSKPLMGEFREVVRGARRVLEGIQTFGVTALPLKGKSGRAGKLSGAGGSKSDRLGPVCSKALACQACRLSKTRRSVVFGEGSLDAKLLFVGEGPGKEEDLQGRPFVGMAGALLSKIIQAMGLTREQVYIANVVKCRPPMNRPPEPDEIAACRGFLESQLSIIAPKVICALGKTAATALLEMEASMSQMRGRTFQWKEIPVVVTFHPAYLLRNPAAKPQVWQDMQRVLALLKR